MFRMKNPVVVETLEPERAQLTAGGIMVCGD